MRESMPQIRAEHMRIYQELCRKLEKHNGRIVGFHGTSADIARVIEEVGFKDQVCVEGGYGIWFYDEDVANTAEIAAKRKAQERGQSRGAVIRAELSNPKPDTKGRKQWLAHSSSITVLDVQYL